MDWSAWHDEYDDPGSELSQRLKVVQTQLRIALEDCAAGPLRIVSLCAGQGRDVLEVLADHPRRGDVHARLVELDAEIADGAASAARALGLDQVEVRAGDAALIDQYVGMVPADIVLACGIFGNISDEDIQGTIAALPQLCRSGAPVIWTRHRDDPDLVPQICSWFESRDFERRYLSEPAAGFGVGVHRYTGTPEPLVPGTHLFTFGRYES
ncbi:SAM-dependent methyltransferase [Kribbella capetownensis]|uniref:SAM-dependent methyltransferase n=1 Tax=Kribbella capetownensis TaxID=1572659 RepID=A0A4R0JTJ3_9ACTN|nr:class I SAM-dependent methyltransferase family protein [Kribbella capetownensis]TCC50723.1 SAM-dependent methyltransferase [Kribbella capetownensis]